MTLVLQRFVDSGLFNETVAQALEEAVNNGESVIIAGDRSTGTRPLTAMVMGHTKKTHEAVQVRKPEDLDEAAPYFMILGIEGQSLEELVAKALSYPESRVITVKEAENPLSINKILKQHFKKHGATDRTFVQLELDKKPRNADGIPFTDKLTRISINEKGKIVKENIEF